MALAVSVVEFMISHEPRLKIEQKNENCGEWICANWLTWIWGLFQISFWGSWITPPMNVTFLEGIVWEIPESCSRSYCMNCSTQEFSQFVFVKSWKLKLLCLFVKTWLVLTNCTCLGLICNSSHVVAIFEPRLWLPGSFRHVFSGSIRLGIQALLAEPSNLNGEWSPWTLFRFGIKTRQLAIRRGKSAGLVVNQFSHFLRSPFLLYHIFFGKSYDSVWLCKKYSYDQTIWIFLKLGCTTVHLVENEIPVKIASTVGYPSEIWSQT